MSSRAFFAVFIVLVLGIIYVMKSSDSPPQTSINQTPKEYIELVEQRKAARIATEKALKAGKQRTDEALEASTEKSQR
ncbi:MAG: aldehyde dehydrogenase [Candidatus Thiodiazotropha taylori]|nr:aldehyde dehydrogenase [Candidatus Thiodiazotropha taylori]MCG8109094.1 aldehyde dehydrogenase [Candidatus Thiodiazotropha taylori]MCG8113383.1 aldehyde dehydrogenase [Candidatus Thiodiazotropha taylori]MCG8125404.1 aldehyde dehydrogenase [Candidatus Thiodiazotropha taylori]MCW4254153.1 aldehyde dehydrogenase [Candidatus Thiodiazotropha taylori]